MSANQALEFSKVPFRDSRYYSYTVAEGVANSVAEMLAETIGEQDPALLAMLHRELRTVREWIIGNRTHPKKIFDKLQEIHRQIAEFQHRGVGNAAEKLHEQAAEFVDVIAQHEARLLDKLLNEREIRRRTLKTLLTDTEIKNMLNYKPFVDGRTIGQWFSKLEFDNASAIFNAVQKGVVNGMTLNSIMQVIQGRQTPQGWEPGILDRNRRSAETLARTVINATANQSRLEMYQANADVIDGVQWRSTLDHRTCMICGAYDGKIWTPDKMSEVKVPPAHPSCRCVLLPYIDVDLGGTRPAEAENFDLMAKEKYEAKYEGKKYDDLSYEYRRRLRYKAIEEYTQSGKEPYKQVSGGTTFADYLKGQPEKFQEEWLGVRRHELYKAGKLDLKDLVKPNNGFKRTVKDLKKDFAPASGNMPTTPAAVPPSSIPPTTPATIPDIIRNADDILNHPAVAELDKKLVNITQIYEAESARLAKERKELTERIKLYSKAFRPSDGLIDWNKNDFTSDDYKAFVKIYNEEVRVRKEYQSALQKERIECFKSLFPSNDTNNVNFVKNVMQKTRCSQDVIDNIAEMVGGIFDRLGISVQIQDADLDLKVKTLPTGGRASAGAWIYSKSGKFSVSLSIAKDEQIKTILHEWGHIIAGLTNEESQLANQDQILGKKLRTWYKDNVVGKPKAGDSLGIASKDTWRQLPIGVPDWYTAKTTGREMESTFFEYLYLNPSKLVQEYPDFVKLILGMMK